MGDFLTHVLHSERVRERIESRRLLEGIQAHPELFRLGAQGPDMLFFHRTFPENGKNSLQQMGHRMHERRTGQFLAAGFDQLASHSWSSEWLELAVYMAGFVCHHCLDRVLHPYVNHAEKKWIWSMDGQMITVSHMEVETALDVLLWQRRGSGPAYRADTAKLCNVGKTWPTRVLRFWREALESVYEVKTDERMMNEVLAHFYRGNRLLYDPKGWKKRLIIWLDSLSGGGIQPPKLPYPVDVSKEPDWLNRRQRTWYNPELPEVKREETVDMLLDRAVDEAANLINQTFSALMSGRGYRQLFPDIRYDNGLPCEPEAVLAGEEETETDTAGGASKDAEIEAEAAASEISGAERDEKDNVTEAAT